MPIGGAGGIGGVPIGGARRPSKVVLGWLQPLGTIARPIGLSLAVIAASGLVLPLTPPAAAADNTQTVDKWLVRFEKAVPVPRPVVTQPFFAYPYVSVQVTTPVWYQPLSRAAARPQVHNRPYQPFVPGALLPASQTVTIDKWQQPLAKQPPPNRPRHSIVTMPSYPYQGVAPDLCAFQPDAFQNDAFQVCIALTRWQQPLSRAPQQFQAKQPPAAIYVPFTAPVAGVQWLQPWQGPPRYLQNLASGQPFVPKEAVRENTVTPDKWLFRFQKAVPVPAVWSTQPFFGYPYVAASNLTTTLEWMQAWGGPPRYWPPRIAAQPFVPKEAVLENTVTPEKWLYKFEKAVPVPKPVVTQPFFGYPYVAQSNLTTTLEWLQPWQGPARYWPLGKPFQPFVPKEAVLENTVTPDKWLIPWQGPPRYWPIKY